MFNKKYVFETRETRNRRRFQIVFFCFVLFLTSYFILGIYIPIFAQNQTEKSAQVFFQRSPDVIAVYTGDAGRLSHTFKKAEKHPSAKIFISGVYSKNNLKTLYKFKGRTYPLMNF